MTSELSFPCAVWSRSQEVDPVGTAGSYRGYLLVEHPLPWPGDVSEIPELKPLAMLATERGLRLQAVVPEDPSCSTRRLISYQKPDELWAGPLVGLEVAAEPERLGETAVALLDGVGEPVQGKADVLICTHGRRDACCGSLGTSLFMEVSAKGLPAGVRLWRTSHTGGHRFAPTAIVLPSATLWAWLDLSLLDQVVSTITSGADEASPDVAMSYRGCATLADPRAQALDRAVIAELGWSALGARRRATELEDHRVRLEVQGAGVWEATVTEARRVPAPACKEPASAATKFDVEWDVTGLTRVDRSV